MVGSNNFNNIIGKIYYYKLIIADPSHRTFNLPSIGSPMVRSLYLPAAMSDAGIAYTFWILLRDRYADCILNSLTALCSSNWLMTVFFVITNNLSIGHTMWWYGILNFKTNTHNYLSLNYNYSSIFLFLISFCVPVTSILNYQRD